MLCGGCLMLVVIFIMVVIVGMIELVIIIMNIIIISVTILDWYDLFQQRECIYISGDFFPPPSDLNKLLNL